MNCKIMKWPTVCCLLVSTLLLACIGAPLWAQTAKEDPAIKTPEDVLKRVAFDQKLNAQVPLNAEFRDEAGKPVRLGQYFGDKPVLMMLIAYRCTMLCTEQTKVLLESLKELKFSAGKEFEIVLVSIDPRETDVIAAGKKESFLEEYGRPATAAGWHVLTGEEASIKQLAQSIGFHYVYEKATDQFAHPDGVVVLTPQGKAARYYFSLNYPARDLRYGLIEASANKIGSPLDYIALLCYHYNPTTGQYSLGILKVLRLISIGFVLMGALWIFKATRRDRRGSDINHVMALDGEAVESKA